MSETPANQTEATDAERPADGRPRSAPRRSWLRRTLKIVGGLCLLLIVVLVIARLMMPSAVLWYVNRTLQQSPLYRGRIDGIDISLWRGAYAIRGIRFNKLTGSVPVPLFRADSVDLSIQWDAIIHGAVVGEVRIDRPELNFVDAPPAEGQKGDDDAGDQTGADGPWLQMLSDLFPFAINRVELTDGSVHFRTYQDRHARRRLPLQRCRRALTT